MAKQGQPAANNRQSHVGSDMRMQHSGDNNYEQTSKPRCATEIDTA
jgi:hypothetical protein